MKLVIGKLCILRLNIMYKCIFRKFSGLENKELVFKIHFTANWINFQKLEKKNIQHYITTKFTIVWFFTFCPYGLTKIAHWLIYGTYTMYIHIKFAMPPCSSAYKEKETSRKDWQKPPLCRRRTLKKVCQMVVWAFCLMRNWQKMAVSRGRYPATHHLG